MMLTKDAYDKFMADLQKKIDETDKQVKERAETTLQTVYDSYKQRLLDKIELETQQVELAKMQGNEIAKRHHETLLGIYKSILDIDMGGAKLLIVMITLSAFAAHFGVFTAKVPFAAVVLQSIRGQS